MRVNFASRYTGIAFLTLLVTAFFPGCSKEPGLSGKPRQEQSAGPIIMQAPNNKAVATVLYLKNGDSIVHEQGKAPYGFSNPDARVFGCGANPYSLVPSIYHGYTSYLSGCPSNPATTITLSFTIETHAQYNLLQASSTYGKVRLIATSSAPEITKTAPLTITYHHSYFNSSNEEVNVFYLTFSLTLTVAEYCNYNEMWVGPSYMPTDCEEIWRHVVKNVLDYLSPQTYKIYPYIASSTSTGQMTVFPGITLCQNCHDPALGSSPTHVFEYRLQGTSTWTAVTYNNLNTQYISVASGTYEYRSKGIITPGVYGGYTAVSTVVVL